MSTSKTLALVAAALVAGLVLGGVGISAAATSVTAPSGGYSLRMGAGFREAKATMADIVAKLTGKPVEDVYESRQDGRSLSEIAKDAGVSSDKVVEEALKARKAVLDESVRAGRINATQEAAMLDRMESRMKSRIDDPTACTSGGSGGGRGRMGGRNCAAGGNCGAFAQ